MITTSQEYKSAIVSNNRHFTFTVTKSDETVFPISQVVSIKIAKRGASQQKLMPGEFCKAQCQRYYNGDDGEGQEYEVVRKQHYVTHVVASHFLERPSQL